MTAGIVGAGAGASTISKKSIYNRVSPARLALTVFLRSRAVRF